MKTRMIGSINCRVSMQAKSGRRSFSFDGTIKGLVLAALASGVKAGDCVKSELGTHVIEAAPHDERCNGFWASRVN